MNLAMHSGTRLPGAEVTLLLVCVGCAANSPARAPVVPERPTLSADTGTTHVRTFELEAGVSYDPSDAFNSPVTLKYGLDETTEIFSGWAPLQWTELPGSDGVGIGDVTVGLRHRYADEGEYLPSAGFQVVGLLPTADSDDGVGSGKPALFVASMATKAVGNVAGTLYYEIGLLAEQGGGSLDVQHSVAASGSLAFDDTWGAFGEVAGVFQVEGNNSPVFTTMGLTYAFEPSMVMDAGVVVGLNGDAPDLVYQMGITVNFGGFVLDVDGR